MDAVTIVVKGAYKRDYFQNAYPGPLINVSHLKQQELIFSTPYDATPKYHTKGSTRNKIVTEEEMDEEANLEKLSGANHIFEREAIAHQDTLDEA